MFTILVNISENRLREKIYSRGMWCDETVLFSHKWARNDGVLTFSPVSRTLLFYVRVRYAGWLRSSEEETLKSDDDRLSKLLHEFNMCPRTVWQNRQGVGSCHSARYREREGAQQLPCSSLWTASSGTWLLSWSPEIRWFSLKIKAWVILEFRKR